jgi:hypothetical protein
MAHFVKVNFNTKLVEQAIVAEQEFVDKLPGIWIQTSYNGSIRKNYAGIGHTYDFVKDAFYAPQPFSSWILNEDTYKWEAPIAYPNDGQLYMWDEELSNWVEIIKSL